MAIYIGKTEVDITIKQYGNKDEGMISRASETTPELVLRSESKHLGLSVQEALRLLVDKLNIF